MKKVEYIVDSFKDFTGEERQFVMAAVSLHGEPEVYIAEAMKYRNHALYAVDAGLINETMVKALLQQEAEYFKANPGRYLAGYDKDAEKYHRSERIEGYIETLEGEAKTTFNYLTEATDEEMEKLAEAVNYVLGE